MRKSKFKIDRNRALSGRPERMPAVKKEEQAGGGLNVTVRLIPQGWLRWLGKTDPVERTFELDPLGREVYEDCDGASDVRTIIRRFAGAHKLSVAEAELSVTAYLKTLMSKGLVGVEIDQKKPE